MRTATDGGAQPSAPWVTLGLRGGLRNRVARVSDRESSGRVVSHSRHIAFRIQFGSAYQMPDTTPWKANTSTMEFHTLSIMLVRREGVR